MLYLVHPAQRVSSQQKIKAGIHTESDEQGAAIAARDLVDFVHLLFHLPKENGIRHGLPYVVHAAHQMGTGFGCDAPHFHGQRYGQEFNDHIVFGQQIAQGLLIIGVHRQCPDAARFIIRFFAFVTCAAIGHGDMGKRIMRQYIVQSPLALQPHAQDQ